jgi:1-phosphatidylinositol-4-phosphate 5-kinase
MAKEGESIYKSHSAYNLITQLQLGIEWSVSFAQRNASGREVSDDDFSKGSPWRQRKVPFYSKGSKQTPKHTAPSFLWKDYYPVVFYRLRQHFEVDSIAYLSSICSSNTLRYLGKPGNSGSSFFISGDDKFIIKIMRKNEVRLLQAILPYYQAHVRNNPDTLLTKFYGLYRIKFSSGKKIRFVVMGNLLTSELSYQRKFDLKGSTYERSTPKHLHPRRHILKDLDMHYTFRFARLSSTATKLQNAHSPQLTLHANCRLESGTTEKLMMQLEADCAMLERMRIIDYSLLLGVHIRSAKVDEAGDEHAGESRNMYSTCF